MVAIYGGFYLDLDLFLNYKKYKDPFKILFSKLKKEKLDYLVTSHFNRYWTSPEGDLYIDERLLFGFKPNILSHLLDYSKKQYTEEKDKCI